MGGLTQSNDHTAEGFFYLTRPLLLGSFYLTRPLLLGETPTFSKTPPSPLNLKRGSTAFP